MSSLVGIYQQFQYNGILFVIRVPLILNTIERNPLITKIFMILKSRASRCAEDQKFLKSDRSSMNSFREALKIILYASEYY